MSKNPVPGYDGLNAHDLMHLVVEAQLGLTPDHGNAPAGAWGGPLVEVLWADDTRLFLRYDKRAGLSKREESLGNVNVRYETFAP